MKSWGILLLLITGFLTSAQLTYAAPIVPGSFSTTWQTDNSGSSNSDQISFYLGTGGEESCTGNLYWEEVGNAANNGSSTLDSNCNLETITFPSDGSYRVDISGDFPTFRFSENGDAQKILTVEQWGDNEWQTLASAFFGASNLTVPAVDAPDLSLTSSLRGMFNGASLFNQSINHWNVSTITSMSTMFYNAVSFNQPLDNWDVSNVTDMRGMFGNAQSFNQPLNSWDVSNVTLMSDGDTARAIFGGAIAFNQPLDNWDVSNVTDFSYLFEDARVFNQPLNNWDVSNATTLAFMFKAAEEFNQPISNWNVTNVTSMESMFSGARVFNQPLDNWDVSNVTTFQSMFAGALDFNQALNNWNTTNLQSTEYMFYFAADFNQPLNNWNTTNLQIADYMFYFASSYNQSLHRWNVQNITNMNNMFTGSALAESKYTKMLNSWSLLSVQPDVYFETDAQYCGVTAQAARDILTNTPNNWVITDGGATTDCVIEVEEEPEPVSSSGSSGTRVGERIKSYFSGTTTSSSSVASVISVTKESFIESVRNFIEYLTQNEADLEKLTPEESTKIIVGLRDIIAFLLKLIPGV